VAQPVATSDTDRIVAEFEDRALQGISIRISQALLLIHNEP
jgi:hypothetical protein